MTHADTTSGAGDAQEPAKEVASLWGEPATPRKEIDSVRCEGSLAAPDPSLEALRRQRAGWGLVLGITPEVRQRRAEDAVRRSSVEDAGLRFLSQHAGKAWLFLLLLAVPAGCLSRSAGVSPIGCHPGDGGCHRTCHRSRHKAKSHPVGWLSLRGRLVVSAAVFLVAGARFELATFGL